MPQSKVSQTLPFDQEQLRQMIGAEFYLEVYSPKFLQDFSQTIAQELPKGKLPEELEKALRRYRGPKKVESLVSETFGIGSLGHFISRQPRDISVYLLGDISNALLADGTPFKRPIVSAKEYLFIPHEVRLSRKRPPIISGIANPFYSGSNRVMWSKWQDTKLYLREAPTCKTFIRILG